MSELYTPDGHRPPTAAAVRRIWRPAVYQSGRKRLGYFEGWYFKCVGDEPVAVIPGVSLDPDGKKSHAFVQLNRPGGRTAYWDYPVSEFRYAAEEFVIEVGPNRFSEHGMTLELDGEAGYVSGSLDFGPWSPWPVRWMSPGIMGWYRFVPFMETYHGVLSMDHTLTGELYVDGARLGFDGGRGYVEKDWGRSFPSAWVWAQSNHFISPGTSVMVSVARIPWMGGSFVGYIVGLLHEGTLYEFTTYNGAKVKRFELGGGAASMGLERGDLQLDVTVEGAHPGKLRSPVLGQMQGTTWESLEATIEVELTRASPGRTGAEREVVFAGSGHHGGAEFMDDDGTLAAGLG